MKQPIIIGIAGGTGSGKTTLARKLKEAFQEDVTILCHDYYYKCNDHLGSPSTTTTPTPLTPI